MTCIDLFAGLGGFTEAAERAGHRVVWAANHWSAAVQIHALNHPRVTHSCQDLQQADFTRVPRHEIQLASPACQGHSPARGVDLPHHDALRCTAWAVVTAAEVHRPEVLVIENVPAFLQWALYPAWSDALRRLGYTLAPHILDAADFGVPQNRVRCFIVATRSKTPLQLTFKARPHKPASAFIELDAGTWSRVRRPGRSAATLARIARGRAELGKTFLIPYYSGGSGLTGRSLSRPIGTITTRARWAIVRGNEMRMLSVPESRAAMGFRTSYQLPESATLATFMLGNAVSPAVGTAVLKRIERRAA